MNLGAAAVVQTATAQTAAVQAVLRLGDTCLILAQRLGQWCGHAPVLEEDIALANIALDLLGQARSLLTHAGRLEGRGRDEDQLAFLREERDYRNVTLVELPNGDFAFTVLRNFVMSVWLKHTWGALGSSSDAQIAAIAQKAIKEARYHVQHSADWVVRLGDGTDESARRLHAALRTLWPYVRELFDDDDADTQAAAAGVAPAPSSLRAAWENGVRPVFTLAALPWPEASPFRSAGKRGQHSEHMGLLLAEMQHLQRAYPGGAW